MLASSVNVFRVLAVNVFRILAVNVFRILAGVVGLELVESELVG